MNRMLTLLSVGAIILGTGFFIYDYNSDTEVVTEEPVDQQEGEVIDSQNEDETTDEESSEENDAQEEAQTEETQVETDQSSHQRSSANVLTCDNCWLAPVDKQNHLPSDYAPTVVSTGLPGGGSLVADAKNALNEMFADAFNDGANLYVRSAYRSYQTQEQTFEKWVQTEMSNGHSRDEAEEIANTYSARPGESEHQLGTTVDLVCDGCGFEESGANDEVWQWLAENAQNYGFVLSYPEGRQDDTGYIYEPWHYRYIGTSNATAYNSQTDRTLNQWLAGPAN